MDELKIEVKGLTKLKGQVESQNKKIEETGKSIKEGTP